MSKLKIQLLFRLLAICGLLIVLFAIYSQQKSPKSEVIKHPSKEVLIAQGHAQAIKDIKAGNPKFYIYGLITYEGTEKIQALFKKHNITPVFEGCVIEEGSAYNFSYNKTIKNAFPDSKNIFNKFL